MKFNLPDDNARQRVKKNWQMYPDVFDYSFSRDDYASYWASIKQSNNPYWMVDGMRPVKVGAARYYWEYVTGNLLSWFGFENHCEPQKVRMAVMKVLYFGYLNGFNADLNTGFLDDLEIDKSYLRDCKKPRSSDYSLSLQASLVQKYKQLKLSELPNDYYFGSTYARYDEFQALANLDPQLVDGLKRMHWPTDTASILELCEVAIKGSTFQSFITMHYMKQCVRDLKPSLTPAQLVELQTKAEYLQEKIPSFKQTYHAFFIELLFNNNQNLRQAKFSKYIQNMSPDVVFGYLKQCFFDSTYLKNLSSQARREYLETYLVPFCELLLAKDNQNSFCLSKHMKLAYEDENNQEKMCDVLVKYDFVAKLLKHDEAWSHVYAALLLDKLNVKQEVSSGLSRVTSWFFSSASSSKKIKVLSADDKKRLLVLIDMLDDDAKYREAKIASYCFEKYMAEKKLVAAQKLFEFWLVKVGSQDELNAMFNAQLIAEIGYDSKDPNSVPLRQENVNTAAGVNENEIDPDLELGREVPQQGSSMPSLFYSQGAFDQQKDGGVDLELGNPNKSKPTIPACADGSKVRCDV